jgi:hypothetical protein
MGKIAKQIDPEAGMDLPEKPAGRHWIRYNRCAERFEHRHISGHGRSCGGSRLCGGDRVADPSAWYSLVFFAGVRARASKTSRELVLRRDHK